MCLPRLSAALQPRSVPALLVLAVISRATYAAVQGGRSSRQCEPMPLWKTTGPEQGQPGTITKYNKTYFWCNTCSFWNTTHQTDQHIRQERGKVTDPTALVRAPPVAAVAAPPVALAPAPFNLSQFGFKFSLASHMDDQDVEDDDNDYFDIETGDISLKD